MAEDFYPFVDSGDPAPDNAHITGVHDSSETVDGTAGAAPEPHEESVIYATRISIYDDMLSTPRVVVVEPAAVRPYLEEVTNTVYRCMKEQGGAISLMVIREIVENFIHAHFVEPIVSILDAGNTIRFADQGPGIEDKERAFEFGVTSADRSQKRYIRGTGAGFPMVQQYLEAVGGAVSIEDNLGAGTVVTVTVDPDRVQELQRHGARGAAVRSANLDTLAAQETQAPGTVMAAGAIPSARMAMPAPQMPPYPQQTMGWAQDLHQQYPYPYGFPAGAPYAQPYPNPYAPGFPQAQHEFSTYQQYPQQPAGMVYGTQAAAPQQSMAPQAPYIDDRGQKALVYLYENTLCGPSDLAQAYGQSGPTWSRVLATLHKQALVIKQGQKYHLTEAGRQWVESR